MYEHTPDEPHDTLVAAIMIAGEVATMEAARDGKTYVLATANRRRLQFMCWLSVTQ
jgi:hypothetical protein